MLTNRQSLPAGWSSNVCLAAHSFSDSRLACASRKKIVRRTLRAKTPRDELMAFILLHFLDCYVNDTLIGRWNTGRKWSRQRFNLDILLMNRDNVWSFFFSVLCRKKQTKRREENHWSCGHGELSAAETETNAKKTLNEKSRAVFLFFF